MNRSLRVFTLLSSVLFVLAAICAPFVGRAATTVATPVISLAAGTYTGAQTVTITDSTSGSKIYYTTNGTTPTTSSTLYSGAITVSASETLEAIATASGDTQSATATAVYTIVGTLNIYISGPGVQSSSVAGVSTETFNELTAGTKYTSPYISPAGIGTYSASTSAPFEVMSYGQYGGANDTNYFAVGGDSGSSNPLYLTLTKPASYIGFWWSAGDANNRVALYSGSTLYGTFSTADLLTLLKNSTGKVQPISGTPYTASSYFGNPNITSGTNDSAEPFAYVSFSITGATITQIAFYNTTSTSTGTSFESDNHSVIFSGNTVTIPTSFVPVENMSLGSQSVSVTVSPASASVTAGGTQQFTATVTGSTNTAVSWTISPATGAGTISTSGKYTAPASVTTPQTVTITATSQANTTVKTTATVSLVATPAVSAWPTASSITYGQTLASSTLTGGTASVPGSFAWTSPSTVPNAGTSAQSVTFTPTSTNYAPVVNSTSVNVTVNKASQTINFPAPASPVTFGVAPIALTATGGASGNPIVFTVDASSTGTGTISGNTLTITGAGKIVIDANQTGNGNYAAAAQVQQSVQVNKASQTINFPAPASPVTFGVAPIALTATGGASGNPIVFTVDASSTGTGTISGNTLTITGAGKIVIDANQTGNGNYAAAAQVQQSVTVNKASQTINFPAPASPVTFGVAPIALTATGGASGNPIVFTVDASSTGTGTISGNTLTITGAGKIVIDANQTGNGNYAAAAQVQQSVQVNKASQTINFPAPASPVTFGVAPIALTATGGASGNPIVFTVDASSTGTGTISGNTLTITGAGKIVIDANQTGNGNYAAAAQVQQSVQVNKASQTINFPAPASPVTFGVAPIALTATGGASGNPIVFTVDASSTGTGTISGNTLTITGAGKIVIDANQTGNGNYAAAAQVQQSVTVNKASQTINFPAPASPVTFGVAPIALTATGGASGNPIVFTVDASSTGTGTISGNTLTITGAGKIVIDANQTGNGNYAAAAQVQQSVTVNKASQTINFPAPASPVTFGVAPIALTATGGASGNPIVFTVDASSTGTGTISGNTLTITGAGKIVIDANQTGNGNYAAAAQVQQSVTVTQALPVISWATPAAITYGTALSATQLDATASVAGSFSYLPNAGTVPSAGTQTLTATFTPTDTADYTTATASVQLTVTQATSVTLSPAVVTLNAGQTQAFTATVINNPNTAVTWSINPTGVGSIDQNGNYTAPATITASQIVVVTAASQAYASATATATITLAPPQCPPGGYGYGRAIAIDHTKVPNTDQASFPFYFNSTDPTLANISYGGHIASNAGNDIIFTSDPQGQNQLNYELQSYNPATGQVIAWIGIPTLSHSADTVIYMFYGNPAITISQANPTAVWDSNYVGVWHLGNGTALSTADSTSNGNNGANNGATPVAGPLGGGMANGQSNEGGGYISVPASQSLANLLQGNVTVSAWVYTNEWASGGIFGKGQQGQPGWNLSFQGSAMEFASGDDNVLLYADPLPFSTGQWAYVTATLATQQSSSNGQAFQPSFYINGSPAFYYNDGSNTPSGDDSSQSLLLGGFTDWSGNIYTSYGGQEDELRISNTTRSADWVATEYNNQATPSTFYLLYPENGGGVSPQIANLYASQSQQFIAIAACSSPYVSWSIPSSAPGTLSSTGLYTAPAEIQSQQAVAVTASNLADGSNAGSATATLLPPVSVAVTPGTYTLYAPGEQLHLTALVTNAINTNVTWSMSPSSVGWIDLLGNYHAPYPLTAQTVTVTATSVQDPTKSASATLTLQPVTINPSGNVILYGGFSEQFSASVPVNWTLAFPGLGDTISSSGLYTTPIVSSITYQYLDATVQSDPLAQLDILVRIYPSSSGITPGYTVLYSGQSQPFQACGYINANGDSSCDLAAFYNWSISPATGAGTIDASGVYTAPLTPTPQQTVTITATSQARSWDIASATLTLNPPINIAMTPSTSILLANQSVQFNSTVTISTDGGYYSGCYNSDCLTWSISPAGLGTINSWGYYTAPTSIGSGQSVVTVTGTYQIGNVSASATATITLVPNTPTISVSPQTITLTGGQSQQYSASVTNGVSNAVTWSMSPAGTGTLSAMGRYTAPPVVTSQQVIVITAVSKATPSLTASATLTLVPSECAAKFYGYERSIVIDHTKVPDSDQPNFPFYFAVTDPLLATTANGGHMASSSGYDIQFSTDPAGFKTLSYELEQYNPLTGQVVAWVQVPILSHSQDTVLYMFYGNAAISASQQNPAGVWDSDYSAAYQFDNAQPGFVLDSTINGNEAWGAGLQYTTGEPGGAASFDGVTSFIELPSNDFASYPVNGSSGAIFDSTVGVWFKTSTSGVILGQTGFTTPSGDPGGWIPALYIDTNGYLRANFFDLQNAQQIVSSIPLNDNNWHYAVLSFNTDETTNTVGSLNSVSSTTSGRETVYLDGQVIGSQDGLIPNSFAYSYSYFLGTGYAQGWAATPSNNNGWFYFNGSLDQVEISSVARSGDWVRAEYLNQSSPSTFFTLNPEAVSGGSLNPLAVTLYTQQSQQFTVLETGMCNAGNAVYSMPVNSPGTLSPTGLYTSPTTIDKQQTVTVTATTLGANSSPLSATITLMPPVGITVAPGLASLPVGGTQQFTANVTNTTNTGVIWSLDPAGVGSLSPSGLYTAPATASAQQTVNVIATSLADPTQSASATVTLGVAAPVVSVITVTPQSAILYASDTQQFFCQRYQHG